MKYSQQTLDYCRSNSTQILDDIKEEYFPNGDFEAKKDAFFDRLDNSNIVINFPFDGDFLFNKKNYVKIVQILPEFLASIFQLGFDKVTTFVEYKDQLFNDDILVSHATLRQTAEIILESHGLLRDLITSGFADQKLRIRILENLNLLKFRKTHYDIIGCFQAIHYSFTILLDLPGDTSTRDIDIVFPQNDLKQEWLWKLVGDLSLPQRILMDQTGLDEVDPKIIRTKIISGFANPGNFPSAPHRAKDIEIDTQSDDENTISERVHKDELMVVPDVETEKQITLIPKNAVKRKHQNQIIVNGNDPIIVQNSPFDFLYWIVWCDQNNKPQLDAKKELLAECKTDILSNSSEKIVQSRFVASWINKDNVQKKWDAQSQINALFKFDLIGSGSDIFSINDGFEIELHPYPIK